VRLRTTNGCWNLIATFSLAILLAACTGPPTEQPIPVKVVVVTMFEIGEDEGDRAGEFQLWKERQRLTTSFEVPNSFHDLFMNTDTGVMGMVTGVGRSRPPLRFQPVLLADRRNCRFRP